MPSPMRRSARAPTKPPPSHSNSSTSSLSSARQDRNAKPATAGKQKSTTPHSQSSEDASEPPRRSQRAQLAKDEDDGQDAINGDDGAADEEETTRCICGHQDYPGPPLSEVFGGVDVHSEDAGGLFIQCDGCTVWQHGGCVGIIEESQSPDKYYCEECKPKQHELHTDSRGQRYSNYLPLHPKANRKGSLGRTDEKSRKEHETSISRASADPVTGRRRGTVRSKEHDEEEEAFRRAIEESKREVDGPGTGRRTAKRGRDDAEDSTKPDIKRQRTASDAHTLATHTAQLGDESDDDTNGSGPVSKSKKARADAVQTARQVKLREKDKERERARAEAAGRRQERAGRRRADESDPAEDTPRHGASARTSPPPSSAPASPPTFAATEKISHKKGAGKKMKKLGNNQYTKARDLSFQSNISSPHSKKRHPAMHDSGEEQGAVHGADSKTSPSTHENGNGHSKVPGKATKGKGKAGMNGHVRHDEPVEKTFVNMKRSMDGMMAFMQRQQIELAGDRTPPGSDSSSLLLAVQPHSAAAVTEMPTSAPQQDGKAFKDLSSMEMADELARNITRWQTLYGRYAS